MASRIDAGGRPGSEPPRVSPWLLGAFARYTRWYLGRHFHAVRLSQTGVPEGFASGIPKVIYLNHASWWDPLVCLHLTRHLFPRHRAHAPIDAVALAKYPFFRRLGFFGIESDSARGAATFARIAGRILDQPGNALWITPQGRFADVRERPVRLAPGLGYLAARGASRRSRNVQPVEFIPLALEYTWWHERLPEVLVHFGTPVVVDSATASSRDARGWTAEFESHLQSAQDSLATEASRRDPARFRNLLEGSVGVGGIYDAWRRCAALLTRRRFEPRHGTL